MVTSSDLQHTTRVSDECAVARLGQQSQLWVVGTARVFVCVHVRDGASRYCEDGEDGDVSQLSCAAASVSPVKSLS